MLDTISLQFIQEKLSGAKKSDAFNHFPETVFNGEVSRDAAVLIPFLLKNDQWEILFIRRSNSPGDIHSGQVAFPGGGREEQDVNFIQNALRESHEEIGLKHQDVEILGTLQPLRTISNYLVRPVIGRIPWPYDFKPQLDEVEHIFSIPLSWLANSSNYKITQREILTGEVVDVIYYKEYLGEIVWGASARMLQQLFVILGM